MKNASTHSIQHAGAAREQARIDVDENGQAWFQVTALGNTDAAVAGRPVVVQDRVLLRDNALLEIGSRRFVFHAAVPEYDPETNNPPSKPASSPFAKTSNPFAAKASQQRGAGTALRELIFSSPHPTPGTLRERLAPTQCALRTAPHHLLGGELDIEPCRHTEQDLNTLTFLSRTPQLFITASSNGEECVNTQHGQEEEAGSQREGLTGGAAQVKDLLAEAVADAQRIRAHAEAEAKSIVARAEDDAKRIRAAASCAGAHAHQKSVDGIVVSASPATKRCPQPLLSAKKQKHAKILASNTSSMPRPRSLPTPPHPHQQQRASLQKAERCLAFFDKMVCLNFLAATEHMATIDNLDELSLEDCARLLHGAGFAAEDIRETLQLLVNDKEEPTPPQQPRSKMPPILDLWPSLQSIPCADNLSSNLHVLSAVSAGKVPAEDSPSTPGKCSRILSNDLTSSQHLGPDKHEEQGSMAAACLGTSPSIGLHPSIRKHPILNWLKKYDPTKDESLVNHDAAPAPELQPEARPSSSFSLWAPFSPRPKMKAE